MGLFGRTQGENYTPACRRRGSYTRMLTDSKRLSVYGIVNVIRPCYFSMVIKIKNELKMSC